MKEKCKKIGKGKKVCPHCGGQITVKMFVGIRCVECHANLVFNELKVINENI